MTSKEKKEILKRLESDEDYYGDFGKQIGRASCRERV